MSPGGVGDIVRCCTVGFGRGGRGGEGVSFGFCLSFEFTFQDFGGHGGLFGVGTWTFGRHWFYYRF